MEGRLFDSIADPAHPLPAYYFRLYGAPPAMGNRCVCTTVYCEAQEMWCNSQRKEIFSDRYNPPPWNLPPYHVTVSLLAVAE